MGQAGFIDRIHAMPAVFAHGHLDDVPAHFGMALIRAEDLDERNNEATKGTYLEGMY